MRVAIRRGVNLGAILDAFYPPACAGCRAAGTALCLACVPRAGERVRFERAGVAIVAAGAYAGTLRRAILALKRGRRDVANPLGVLLARTLAREGISHRTLVVPVPTTSANASARGFDQGIALARAVAAYDGRPVLAILRKRAGRNQRGRNRLERLRASRRFEALQPRLLAGAEVVLLDDVVTTGATLADCAATLTACGARVRGAFVLAHA